jgi:hypothetical protein
MRFSGGRRTGKSKKERRLSGKERRELQEADEEAGLRSPPIPDDPPRVKKERDYLSALRSPFSRLDGSPPRGVNRSTALGLSHKRRGRKP